MSFKLTGIGAIAVAGGLLLSMGMGTATATVLCSKSETTKCSAPYGNEVQIKASLAGGSKFIVDTAYRTIECEKSMMVIKGPVNEGPVEELTFSECDCEVKSLHNNGLFFIEDIPGTDNGEFGLVTELTTSCPSDFGTVHCIYLAFGLGTLTGGNPAIMEFNNNLLTRPTNFLCEGEKRLTVKYEVTSPKPLYVSAS